MENTQKNIEKNLQSSKKHSYNLHSPGVRTYKDSVFCRIFNEKKELLSLYNALFLEQRNENILKYGLVKIPTPAELTLQKGKLTKANLPFWFYTFNTL